MMRIIKINWGARIVILYLGFVALIITLVCSSLKQDFDLVSRDYYSEELRYQDVINASRNQAALSEAVRLQQKKETVELLFPAEFRQAQMSGKAHFYSQVNAARDRTFDLRISDRSCTVDIRDLQPAGYLVKLRWTNQGKSYYQETAINILP